jgi:glutamate racemase
MDTRPIGIFDSGSGGLTIWKSVVTLLPHESTIYIGDHRHLPYSTKTIPFIRERGKRSIQFLLSKDVKLIVIACNTATVAAIDYFRKKFPHIPIVGVVPVVKTAALRSKIKKFAVLSTLYTAKSAYQKKLISTFASGCRVFSIGNTELVRLIEEGKIDSPDVYRLLETIFRPILSHNIDVLVLGCTHFPFLRKNIEDIVGPHVLVLDSGDAVSRHVKHILDHEGLSSSASIPRYDFFTTGNVKKVNDVVRYLLGRGVVVKPVPYSVQ